MFHFWLDRYMRVKHFRFFTSTFSLKAHSSNIYLLHLHAPPSPTVRSNGTFKNPRVKNYIFEDLSAISAKFRKQLPSFLLNDKIIEAHIIFESN